MTFKYVRQLSNCNLALLIWAFFQAMSCVRAQEVQKPAVTIPYTLHQTFKGQAFFKDDHVWVYTLGFAQTFGMPLENVDNDLKGIEAAAFRVEDKSYQMCGMGGKGENCKENTAVSRIFMWMRRNSPCPGRRISRRTGCRITPP